MSGYIIKANTSEAMLIDRVLTLHNYDEDYLDYLLQPDVQQLRYQAGRIIAEGRGELELMEEEVRWLLATLPVTFHFGKEDVGCSLKKKLREAYLGKRPWFHSIFSRLARFFPARMPFSRQRRARLKDMKT